MLLSLSKSTEAHSISPSPLVLLFAMLRYQTIHRLNHVFGNVFMNITVKQLSISTMKIFARHLLNYVIPIGFNLVEMFDQVLFVIEKIMVSLFAITILQRILFLEPVSTCSSTLTTVFDVTTSTTESMCTTSFPIAQRDRT